MIEQKTIEHRIKSLYNNFHFPYSRKIYYSYSDPLLWLRFINQDIGYWDCSRISKISNIWVAGCGINQAITTAIKFPESKVYGSDISEVSIELSKKTSEQLSLKNLELDVMSLNDADFEEEFDYIICTGVIHNNTEPSTLLNKLAKALKKDGILEIMVYNKYHMLFNDAYIKGLNKLCKSHESKEGIKKKIDITKKLISDYPLDNLMKAFFSMFKKVELDCEIADAFFQPMTHYYTVDSLQTLSLKSGLEILHPVYLNKFEKQPTWDIDYKDDELNKDFYNLTDIERWEVANHLMFEQSPILWFYLQKKESNFDRKSEDQINNEFLDMYFTKNTSTYTSFVLNNDKYNPMPNVNSLEPIDVSINNVKIGKLMNDILMGLSLREALHKNGLKNNKSIVNKTRVLLTTTYYPYLFAINNFNIPAHTDQIVMEKGDFNF